MKRLFFLFFICIFSFILFIGQSSAYPIFTEYFYLTQLALKQNPKEIPLPHNIALDSNDNVYVTIRDIDTNKGGWILKYECNKKYLPLNPYKDAPKKIGSDKLKSPGSIAIDKVGNIYVKDTDPDRIVKFNSKGDFVKEWGDQTLELYSNPDKKYKMKSMANLAMNPLGQLCVNDYDAARIYIFSPFGDLMDTWEYNKSQGGHMLIQFIGGKYWNVHFLGHGWIRRHTSKGDILPSVEIPIPQTSGAAVDLKGCFYLTDEYDDKYKDRVYKCGPDGKIITEFGTYGLGDGEFRLPRAIAVSPDGRHVFVVDYQNGRVQLWRAKEKKGPEMIKPPKEITLPPKKKPRIILQKRELR
ncbi:MAG: NHL repeat-containing protein [Candidatus Margulisiibacteriota bacterium]